MSNARKLQTEIERCMKKVDEGVELFDEIWEKVYSAEQQNQKEKYEMDLKKEIKKLQRQRDQIKTWISSSEVKDKDPLIEARKLIESKMEQFKICEKETKTKTYSKEGLAREDKLDPEDQAKLATTDWIGEYIEKFNQELEEKEFEIEKLSSGKGKKSNKSQLEALQQHVTNHKFHISKLEGIIRLVNNDRLGVDVVDPLKDDLDYYLECYEDEDYAAAYDADYFYEALGLDDLDIVNVDTVTQAPTTTSSKKSDADTTSLSSRGSKEKTRGKKSALSTVIPLTIGRARSKQEKAAAAAKEKEAAEEAAKAATPSKAGRSAAAAKVEAPRPAVAPAPTTTTTTAQPPGTSMAAMLKRESEQQEKERQQKLAREQQAKAQAAEQLRQQQQAAALAQRQQQEAARQQQEAARLKQQQQQQEALRLQQQKQQSAAAPTNDAKKLQDAQVPTPTQQLQPTLQAPGAQLQQAPGPVADNQAQKDAMINIPPMKPSNSDGSQSAPSNGAGTAPGPNNSAIDILTAGLGGLGLGNAAPGPNGPSDAGPNAAVGNVESLRGAMAPGGTAIGGPGAAPGSSAFVSALSDSFAAVPNSVDHERAATGTSTYVPQNPYPTPATYPATPSAIFDKPAVFEKLGTDALFFIFYYAQGSYQQYLAARELKNQSWRFHKKYMTWFQRHEEPQITTDEYEQGTYVYFDYEAGWCTRIKQDFRFEYSYLEDSLQ
eukprot:CAMPEP_0172439434 /NCGR_PEP_ID=MMETSP1065-20121228/423_1 /TAXON_ID=265537 /ORGANISM="Amphiprora paludosa, Strain CCMP125" /LENGTH=716 /DNA_ID=CAMNT_0013188117 /DNA_START=38 /DNA_END=2188 /DNA_ORIENTATION=-